MVVSCSHRCCSCDAQPWGRTAVAGDSQQRGVGFAARYGDSSTRCCLTPTSHASVAATRVAALVGGHGEVSTKHPSDGAGAQGRLPRARWQQQGATVATVTECDGGERVWRRRAPNGRRRRRRRPGPMLPAWVPQKPWRRNDSPPNAFLAVSWLVGDRDDIASCMRSGFHIFFSSLLLTHMPSHHLTKMLIWQPNKCYGNQLT
jgi:hypothetical protein